MIGDILLYKFIGKKNHMYEIIKFNSNCPKEEKTGEGPGSCGGSDKIDSKVSINPEQKILVSYKDKDKNITFIRNKDGTNEKRVYDIIKKTTKITIVSDSSVNSGINKMLSLPSSTSLVNSSDNNNIKDLPIQKDRNVNLTNLPTSTKISNNQNFRIKYDNTDEKRFKNVSKNITNHMLIMPDVLKKNIRSIEISGSDCPRNSGNYEIKGTVLTTNRSTIKLWNPSESDDVNYFISHESAHTLDIKLGKMFMNGRTQEYTGGISESDEWKNVMKYENMLGVSDYARTNIGSKRYHEDFAESVAMYISDRQKFNKDNPLRTKILDKLFK